MVIGPTPPGTGVIAPATLAASANATSPTRRDFPVPAGAGTRVRMTETGFRERGWEAAVLEEAYRDHVNGWDHYVPLLAEYVDRLVASR